MCKISQHTKYFLRHRLKNASFLMCLLATVYQLGKGRSSSSFVCVGSSGVRVLTTVVSDIRAAVRPDGRRSHKHRGEDTGSGPHVRAQQDAFEKKLQDDSLRCLKIGSIPLLL